MAMSNFTFRLVLNVKVKMNIVSLESPVAAYLS